MSGLIRTKAKNNIFCSHSMNTTKGIPMKQYSTIVQDLKKKNIYIYGKGILPSTIVNKVQSFNEKLNGLRDICKSNYKNVTAIQKAQIKMEQSGREPNVPGWRIIGDLVMGVAWQHMSEKA